MGTGYTMEEVKELNAKVEPYKVPYGKAGKAAGGKAWPKWLHHWNMKADDGTSIKRERDRQTETKRVDSSYGRSMIFRTDSFMTIMFYLYFSYTFC